MTTNHQTPRSRKQKVAETIRRICPKLADMLEAHWFRQHTRRWHWDFQKEIAAKLYSGSPITVLSGPFRGMIYENRVYFGSITPRWIGSYEMELHPVVEEIARGHYEAIVDIGSAEGYYSIGLARLIPETPVYSFETDWISRWQQKRLARFNKTANLILAGFCHHQRLEEILKRRACVICDIEGWEIETLDPARVPGLARADILVEIHPFKELSGTQCGMLIEERFRDTHAIRRIRMEVRTVDRFRGELSPLTENEAQEAMNEHRGREQEWLWLKSRHWI